MIFDFLDKKNLEQNLDRKEGRCHNRDSRRVLLCCLTGFIIVAAIGPVEKDYHHNLAMSPCKGYSSNSNKKPSEQPTTIEAGFAVIFHFILD
jgi:hypothetical protein